MLTDSSGSGVAKLHVNATDENIEVDAYSKQRLSAQQRPALNSDPFAYVLLA